jgi:hypothetical protein
MPGAELVDAVGYTPKLLQRLEPFGRWSHPEAYPCTALRPLHPARVSHCPGRSVATAAPGTWRHWHLPGQHDLPTAKRQVHVNKILPPPRGLLGATWRLVPSHQLVGALDPPAVTSVSAPSTRSLADFCSRRGGPGGAPFWARSPRKGLGPKRVWVRAGSWRGSDRQHRRGAGAPRRASSWHGSRGSVETTAVPLRCYCGAIKGGQQSGWISGLVRCVCWCAR